MSGAAARTGNLRKMYNKNRNRVECLVNYKHIVQITRVKESR